MGVDDRVSAETLEAMRERVKKIDEEIAGLKEKRKEADGDPERADLEATAARLEARKQMLLGLIAQREDPNRKVDGT